MKRLLICTWLVIRYAIVVQLTLAWVTLAVSLLLISLCMRTHGAALRMFTWEDMLRPLVLQLRPAPAPTPAPAPAPRHRGVTTTPATRRRREAGQGGRHSRPSTTPPPAPAPRTGADPWPPIGQLSTDRIIRALQSSN